jgi:hypothetical protein
MGCGRRACPRSHLGVPRQITNSPNGDTLILPASEVARVGNGVIRLMVGKDWKGIYVDLVGVVLPFVRPGSYTANAKTDSWTDSLRPPTTTDYPQTSYLVGGSNVPSIRRYVSECKTES